MAKIIISQGGKAHREVELDKDRMVLGRKPHNDIIIPHSAISGEHAVFTCDLAEVFVEDLGSTNGTFLNGRRVTKALLEDHDVLVVGKSEIEFLAGPRRIDGTPLPVLPPPEGGATIGSIEVLSGSNQGKTLRLVKPITTLGRAGVQVIAIARQGDAYFFTHVDGHIPPLLNGKTSGKTTHQLQHGDAIELAGASMAFYMIPDEK